MDLIIEGGSCMKKCPKCGFEMNLVSKVPESLRQEVSSTLFRDGPRRYVDYFVVGKFTKQEVLSCPKCGYEEMKESVKVE